MTTISSQHVAFCTGILRNMCEIHKQYFNPEWTHRNKEKEPLGLVIDEGHQAGGGDARNI